MSNAEFIKRAGFYGEDIRRFPSSWYAATVGSPVDAPALDRNEITDFCVIGGGFAGLGAALSLARAGKSVRLVEMGPIGWGASGRNGGQVHVGWQQDMDWFERKVGQDDARALWAAALEARDHLDGLLDLCPDRCDWRQGLIHADHKPHYVSHTHAHVRMMQERYGHAALAPLSREELRALVNSPDYHGGYADASGGHLHPLKLVNAIARAAQAAGAILHAETPCTKLKRAGDGWDVITPLGTIRAGAVLDATGAYARALVPKTDPHVLPINNYIATTEPLGETCAKALIANGAAVSDSRFVIYYFRMTPDHRLLFGGGESYGTAMPRDIAATVRPHIARVFPQLQGVRLDHAWGGTLAISPNRLPFLIEHVPGLWAANGFSGLGIVLGPWLGDLAGRAMMGLREPLHDLMRRLPAPRFPGGRLLRLPTQAIAMHAMALRDRF